MPVRSLIIGIVCLVLAVVIFVFADGLRRWYSGAFFLIIGLWILFRTRQAGSAEKSE